MASSPPGLPLPRPSVPKQDGFCPFNGERCEAPFCERDCAKDRQAFDLRAAIRSGQRITPDNTLGLGVAGLFGFLIGGMFGDGE
jgi:hypothetical protein